MAAAIEAGEAAVQKRRDSQAEIFVDLAKKREEKTADATAMGETAQKLLALEGTLAAQDRPRADQQRQQQQQSASSKTDPARILEKLCHGRTACLLPTLVSFFHDQVKRLDEESTLAENFFFEEEPLPEGKFHVEVPKVPQVPLQPSMGASAPLTPNLLAGMAEAGKTVPDAPLLAEDALRVNADFMEAEAERKREQEANPLEWPSSWRSSGGAALKLHWWMSTLSSQASHRDVSTRT